MGEPARGYTRTRPPFEAGNSVARTHGATARDVPEAALQIVEDLVGSETYREHPELSLRAAETWTRIRRAERWLEERGDLDEDGKPWPVVAAVAAWDAALVKLSDRLGLSPLSAARLDLLRSATEPVRHDVRASAVDLLDRLQERRDKKAEAGEAERVRAGRGELLSPPRLALGPGKSDVPARRSEGNGAWMDGAWRDQGYVDDVRSRAAQLLLELERRRDGGDDDA